MKDEIPEHLILYYSRYMKQYKTALEGSVYLQNTNTNQMG